MTDTRAPYVPAPYKADPDETVKCPNCGKMNDVDAHFCDQCDQPLATTTAYRPDPDETVKCPNCGGMNDLDATFCDQCGYKLAGDNGVQVSAAPRSARPPRDNLVRATFPGFEVRAAADPTWAVIHYLRWA